MENTMTADTETIVYQYLIFKIDNENYSINVSRVRDIVADIEED